MAQKFMFRFIIPKYKGLEKSDFQNSAPRLNFLSRVIFVIFHIFRAFLQIGHRYLFLRSKDSGAVRMLKRGPV